MFIATKTLEAIETALKSDQGASYRRWLKYWMPLSPDAYDDSLPEPRSHLGASLLGRKCDRELWYSFRWATNTVHSGTILRLFNRGHLEEPRILALFSTIGVQVFAQTDDGEQFRINGYKGHVGGGIDSVLLGVPDFPDIPMLGEFKTHNDKSWNSVVDEGVRYAKKEHFVQMQLYMDGLKLTKALYIAVNKNNDQIHAEIIDYEADVAAKYKARGEALIDNGIPARLPNASKAWYECKFCDHRGVCLEPTVPPVRSCRSCRFVSYDEGGMVLCTAAQVNPLTTDPVPLTKSQQLLACNDYMRNADFKKDCY